MPQPQPAEPGEQILGLGKLILDKGLATQEEVARCLAIQRESADSGVFLRLGEIFVREGILSPEQVQDLLAIQNVKILICPDCLSQFNIKDWAPGREERCPRCDSVLKEPQDLKSLAVEDTVAEGRPAPQPLGFIDASVRFFGNYEILGEISRGGMGIVYKARQRELNRIVALKVLLTQGESRAEDIQRFQREARAVARLRHHNIIGIHEIGEHRGIHFFSMNYIQGVPLDKYIGKDEISASDLQEMLRKICFAVDYAHSEGVLHRDLKPTNILVTKKKEPYLIDFGIAKFRGEQHLTREGFLYGSPLYMAPEYVAGKLSAFDARCDVYSLGVILYQIVSGVTPFQDDDTVKILRRILQEEPTPVQKVAPHVDRDLATICSKAIEKDPVRRYPTAREMGEDLGRYLRGEEIVARPRSLWVKLWLKAREKVAFLAMLALATLVLYGAWRYPRELQQAKTALAEREDELRLRERKVESLRQELLAAAEKLHAARQHQAALAILDSLVPDLARSAKLHYLRHQVLVALGRTEEAQRALARAKELDPGSR